MSTTVGGIIRVSYTHRRRNRSVKGRQGSASAVRIHVCDSCLCDGVNGPCVNVCVNISPGSAPLGKRDTLYNTTTLITTHATRVCLKCCYMTNYMGTTTLVVVLICLN